MPPDPPGPADLVALLDDLVADTVRRARALTPRAWREATPQAGTARREVALGLASAWAVHAQELELGTPAAVARRPRAPAHDFALADMLAVTGSDLLSALRAAGGPSVRGRAAAVIAETDTYRWHLLGAPVPARGEPAS